MREQQYSNIDSASAIALVLSKSTPLRSASWPHIRDVAEVLVDLGQMGFKFRDLGLRKMPDGFYSEDVENFVGRLLSMGYATQRSPIKLQDKGAKFCEGLLAEEASAHGDEVDRLDKAVDEVLSRHFGK